MGNTGEYDAQAWTSVLEQSSASRLLREAPLVLETLTILHLIAVGVLLVVLLGLDTRLLRAARQSPRIDLSAPLTVAAVALAVALVSGGILFAANPTQYLGSAWFPVKLVLVIGVALNATWMYRHVHLGLRQRQSLSPRLPWAAGASLAGWGLLVAVSLLPPG